MCNCVRCVCSMGIARFQFKSGLVEPGFETSIGVIPSDTLHSEGS